MIQQDWVSSVLTITCVNHVISLGLSFLIHIVGQSRAFQRILQSLTRWCHKSISHPKPILLSDDNQGDSGAVFWESVQPWPLTRRTRQGPGLTTLTLALCQTNEEHEAPSATHVLSLLWAGVSLLMPFYASVLDPVIAINTEDFSCSLTIPLVRLSQNHNIVKY